MTRDDLKTCIEKVAEEMNISFIEAASAVQSAAAKLDNEEIIPVISEMKLAHIETMGR